MWRRWWLRWSRFNASTQTRCSVDCRWLTELRWLVYLSTTTTTTCRINETKRLRVCTMSMVGTQATAGLLFLWAKGLNANEIHYEMGAVYGDKCFTKPAMHVWCTKFARGMNSHQIARCNQSFVSHLDSSQHRSLHPAFSSLLTYGTNVWTSLDDMLNKSLSKEIFARYRSMQYGVNRGDGASRYLRRYRRYRTTLPSKDSL